MELKTVKLRNFRGYKESINIEMDNLIAFIGKNDAGKSTILEALEIFFNNSLVVCEREDLNVNALDSNVEITCVFTNLPSKIVIDTSSETTLESEFLLNENKELEIKKIFRMTSQKPRPTIHIICDHPTEEPYNNLLLLKRNELKKLANDLSISTDQYNANNNASLRKAIWRTGKDLKFQLQEIQVDKEDTKKIYESLEKFLPIYSLFQSDRASKDNDKEVTDPMGLAVEQALKELMPEIETIKSKVRDKAIETANRTLEKLQEMDKDLADSLLPDFKSEPKFDSLFKLSIKSDDDISINKRGSGVRRLILLNFFRAEVERKLEKSDAQNVIYAFEEPETSQHPKHQEMLIKSFLELAHNTNSQVILTTHTPALAGLLPLESLRFVTSVDGLKVVKSNDEKVYEEITDTLGLLAENINIQTKAILLLEGQGDVVFMRHLCEKLKEGGVLQQTLQESGFAFIPTGGCGNLKAWKTLKLAEQFNVPWCVLQDSDQPTPEAQKNIDMINTLKKQKVKAYLTRKREPENYLHTDCFEFPVKIENFNDVKKEVNMQNRKVAASKVLESYWPKMSYQNIREVEKYIDEDGHERYEFTEMIIDFLSLVKPAVTKEKV